MRFNRIFAKNIAMQLSYVNRDSVDTHTHTLHIAHLNKIDMQKKKLNINYIRETLKASNLI